MYYLCHPFPPVIFEIFSNIFSKIFCRFKKGLYLCSPFSSEREKREKKRKKMFFERIEDEPSSGFPISF